MVHSCTSLATVITLSGSATLASLRISGPSGVGRPLHATVPLAGKSKSNRCTLPESARVAAITLSNGASNGSLSPSAAPA